MVFQNLQVEIKSLPQLSSLEFLRPDPSYLKVIMLGNSLFFTLLSIPVGILLLKGPVADFGWAQIGGTVLWLLIIAFSYWVNWKGFYIQGYALREKDIHYKRGLLFHSLTSIPFNRVQHCEIKQGPIARRFGLSTLEIFTAGGQSSDLRIPGIDPHRAQQIKEFIINKTSIEEDGAEV